VFFASQEISVGIFLAVFNALEMISSHCVTYFNFSAATRSDVLILTVFTFISREKSMDYPLDSF
jgi:hypothetical protein